MASFYKYELKSDGKVLMTLTMTRPITIDYITSQYEFPEYPRESLVLEEEVLLVEGP